MVAKLQRERVREEKNKNKSIYYEGAEKEVKNP